LRVRKLKIPLKFSPALGICLITEGVGIKVEIDGQQGVDLTEFVMSLPLVNSPTA
jgi:hypothetical protein